jgi:radical SAM enzyme (TIGR01210 family)
MQIQTNPFLAAVMRAVRAGRPALRADQPFFNRVEKVPNGNYIEVWFRTGGCTWDHVGGCTMCNYGFGTDINTLTAEETVRTALGNLTDHADELMVSPSGGMWDPREVPTDALVPIYKLAAAVRPQRFFIETRAETVTSERIRELKAAFPETELAVELGLESWHDGVLAFCVNKGSSSQQFVRAAEMLREQEIYVYANVSLGTAFLDRAIAVRDAIATVKWALSHGATNAVVFPLHVKPFTLLEFMQRHSRYQPISLWDLVEVLHVLGPEFSSQVEIAWYKSYYDTAEKIKTSPVGCAECTALLMAELDQYRARQQYEVVTGLENIRCTCSYQKALASLPIASDEQLASSILRQYSLLASELDLEAAWRRFSPRLTHAIYEAFQEYSATLTEVTDHVA